jgi:hypothetical protein
VKVPPPTRDFRGLLGSSVSVPDPVTSSSAADRSRFPTGTRREALVDPRTGWWRRNAKVFVGTSAIVAATVLMLALTTDLRAVMHGSLLVVSVAAFLPFILLGALLLLLLLGLLLMGVFALLGDADLPVDLDLEVAQDGTSEPADGAMPVIGVRAYYRFLGRRRHPVFWGIPTGLLLGALSCWAVLGITVLPREVATAQRLTEVFETLEAHDAIPKPTEDDQLVLDGQVVLDGFDRPLRYQTRGAWKLRVWRARSAGADGRFETADDLCISGRTALVGHLAEIAETLAARRFGERAVAERLEGVLAMRCRP